jgi:hypothetical protein
VVALRAALEGWHYGFRTGCGLVLVLLTADGPILVRAALGTRARGRHRSLRFQRCHGTAGRHRVVRACLFLLIGRRRQVQSGDPIGSGGNPSRVSPDAGSSALPELDRRSLLGIISNLFSRGNVVERIHGGRHHPCLRPAIISDVGIEGRLSGRHSSWRGASCRYGPNVSRARARRLSPRCRHPLQEVTASVSALS